MEVKIGMTTLVISSMLNCIPVSGDSKRTIEYVLEKHIQNSELPWSERKSNSVNWYEWMSRARWRVHKKWFGYSETPYKWERSAPFRCVI